MKVLDTVQGEIARGWGSDGEEVGPVYIFKPKGRSRVAGGWSNLDVRHFEITQMMDEETLRKASGRNEVIRDRRSLARDRGVPRSRMQKVER